MDNRSQAIYEEGIKFYKQKKYQTATTIFVKLSKNEPESSGINFFAGISLFILNKYNLAIPFFKKVIDIKRNYQQTMKSCVFLGYIYICRNKYEEAFNILRLPVESKFKDPYAYSLMGYLAHQNKKYSEADMYFKKSLEINPDNSLFNNNYGYNLLIWKKDPIASMPYLKKAVEKKSNAANLHSLGWALFQDKKYKESQKFLTLALKKSSQTLIKKHLEMVKKKIDV